MMAGVFKAVPPRTPTMPTSTRRPRLMRDLMCDLMRCMLPAGALLAALVQLPLASAAEPALRPWPAGQATPPLQLVGLDGQDWDLARLRGKVVVVNFWASWCEPCVHELPVLGALARRPDFGGRVAVVGVNYKEPLDSIERFTGAHPFSYPVLRDKTGEMFKRWTAGVMPTTILVDRQGRARWRTAGEIGPDDARLEQAITALLAQ